MRLNGEAPYPLRIVDYQKIALMFALDIVQRRIARPKLFGMFKKPLVNIE
jgi:hypothetical protein